MPQPTAERQPIRGRGRHNSAKIAASREFRGKLHSPRSASTHPASQRIELRTDGGVRTMQTRDRAVTDEIADLERTWRDDPRSAGVRRDYAAADVVRLRGSLRDDHRYAR